MKKVEVLSPVGNMEMLYQAVHNGADAVYLAGKNYGARKFSNNFTNDELIDVIKYCHLYGVMVYVTINTMIYEYEVDDFIKYVEFLYINGVDAVIMQDIGMIKLVRKKFPNLDIHASTQCHTHNIDCVKLLKDLGVVRVVVAREMSLDEIKSIDIDIEKEVFVYGALCVSYSGQCLFSSLNGGRSGNRGECVGSCRLPYKLVKNNQYVDCDGNYLISMKDLNTIDKLREIIESGATSLKIEGRMKSPEYVGYVTRIYRTLVDKYYNSEDIKLSGDELNNLKKLFNRGFTYGYLFNSNDVSNIKSPNHIGVKLGEVIKVDKSKIYIKLDCDIYQEDGIRFVSNNEGMIVNRLYDKKGLLVNKVLKGNVCVIDNKIGLKKTGEVLKTIDSKLIKDIDDYKLKKIPVKFSCEFKIDKKFRISISDGINIVEEYGEVVDKAINRSVSDEDIIKCINKLGNTPFVNENIEINKDENIFISLRNINEVRRTLVDKLINIRETKKRDIIINDYKVDIVSKKENNKINLNVLVRNEEQLKSCIDNRVDNIYITDYSLYLKYNNLDNVYYRVDRVSNKYPDINNGKILATDNGSINKYRNSNYLVSDYYLNIANSYSVNLLNDMGVSRVTLSVELDKSKIRDIASGVSDVELIIYGRLELMIMKYCPLKKCLRYCKLCKNSQDKFSLEDKFGNRYPMIRENCITHIMHYKNIDYISDILEYKEMGISNFRIELFDCNYLDSTNIIKRVREML